MGFVVERTSRSGRVEERFVIARPRASIGRAYDNDIILSDPYTTAHQLVVTNDLNGLAVEVVDDQGATQKSGVPIGEGRTPIESGVEITVGRTHLRVWTTNHPVPPPLAFDRLDQVFDTFTQPSWMAALLGAWLGVQMADFFLVRFREVAFSDAALALLSPMLMPIAWALIWSVISRISRGEPRFFLHLLAAIIFQVFTTLAEWLVKLVAFNTGSLAWIEGLEVVFLGIGIALLLSLSLRFTFRQSVWARQAFAQGIAWSVVGYTLLMGLSNSPEFMPYPQFDGTLLPESLHVSSAESAEDFVENAKSLFEFPASSEKN